MQPHQQVPDSTQQTTAEDRISRRVHERFLLMPGVIDRRDRRAPSGTTQPFWCERSGAGGEYPAALANGWCNARIAERFFAVCACPAQE